MIPQELGKDSFLRYPPHARELAVSELGLLRALPLAFLPLLLRELIGFDWKFPVEKDELLNQFRYLHAMSSPELQKAMAPFQALRLTKQLEEVDWVNVPGIFAEQLSAHLWATHQIDSFRSASVEYIRKLNASAPKATLTQNRVGIVLVGAGVRENRYPLFRKLRPHGTYFQNVQQDNGFESIFDYMRGRSSAHPIPFAHWYIDGDLAAAIGKKDLACVSYRPLASVRDALLERIRSMMRPGGGGPEKARTALAQITPDEVGLHGTGEEAVLDRFQLSILTEGSGTQVFSTTFVQWTAREALRRAQPLTLLVRFMPRQQEQSMTETLITPAQPKLDANGSLIDADMSAYYTWINMQRLSGADQASFLVWFEGRNEAVAISPAFAKGATNHESINLQALLKKLG